MTKELLRNENINGRLLARFTEKGTDFICCTNYVEKNGKGSWDSGEYFESLDSAMDCFHNRMPRKRLEEIASLVIDGLMEDDKETAFEYLTETVRLTNFEARWLNLY